MTPKDQRLALSYWEGHRWLYLKREQDGSEHVQYVPANAIEQTLLRAKEVSTPEEFTICKREVRVLDGHPSEALMSEAWHSAPDYPNSLPDCFRIQAKLDHQERGRFADALFSIFLRRCWNHPGWTGVKSFDYANASAADRTEALLVALKFYGTT